MNSLNANSSHHSVLVTADEVNLETGKVVVRELESSEVYRPSGARAASLLEEDSTWFSRHRTYARALRALLEDAAAEGFTITVHQEPDPRKIHVLDNGTYAGVNAPALGSGYSRTVANIRPARGMVSEIYEQIAQRKEVKAEAVVVLEDADHYQPTAEQRVVLREILDTHPVDTSLTAPAIKDAVKSVDPNLGIPDA